MSLKEQFEQQKERERAVRAMAVARCIKNRITSLKAGRRGGQRDARFPDEAGSAYTIITLGLVLDHSVRSRYYQAQLQLRKALEQVVPGLAFIPPRFFTTAAAAAVSRSSAAFLLVKSLTS